MKNIRHSVFETNSSSTHSISISQSSNGIYDTIVPLNGSIYLRGGEFGWEWKKYNDPIVKANYASLFAKDNNDMTDMLSNVIKEHTGAKEVIFDYSGYIDHQSNLSENGKALEAFSSKEKLKDWIFNSESWLFTGNDNSGAPPNFYDVDPGIEYNYELSIEGLNLIEKFKVYPSKEELIESLYNLASHHPILKRDHRTLFKKPEYQLWYNYFEDCSKKTHTSFDKFEENLIVFFESEPVHTPKRKLFKGYKIISTKEFKFKITKI